MTAGGEAILKGSGCAPTTDVTLRLDGGATLGQTKADAEGLFVGMVTIPATTSLGRHVMTATCPGDDGKELVQELPLTVTAAEEPIPLDPTLAAAGAATPGGVALVKGAGCRPDSVVLVALDTAAPVTATAGPEGGFLAEPKVPADARPGQLKVTATCTGYDGAELIQTASLEIVPPEPQPTETKPSRVSQGARLHGAGREVTGHVVGRGVLVMWRLREMREHEARRQLSRRSAPSLCG